MFDVLFGWRKASKCKKLIKRVQCRLKLLKNKRIVIAQQLREDIAQLFKYGYPDIAFNRIEQLYMDEEMIFVYELLDQFSEFIILNLSFIRRHRNLPKDVNEAISTLIFASARCSDLPELRRVRELFKKCYGQRFTTSVVELHPENHVNCQMKDKLTLRSVSEEKKNRLLNEIVKDFFYKPMQLALDYKPDSQVQSPKVTELYEIQGQETSVKENISTSSSCSVVLQSSPSTAATSKLAEVHKCTQLISNPYYEYEMCATDVRRVEKAGCSSESSSGQYYSDQDSFVYLDDVQEFKSPTKPGKDMHCVDQDQRFFMFGSTSSFCGGNLAKKLTRKGSVSKEKQSLDDLQSEIYYGHRPSNNRRKYQKEVVDQNGIKVASSDCSLDQPCYFYTNNSNAVMFHKGKQGVEKVAEYQVEGEEIQEMGLTTTSPDVPQTPFEDYMDSTSPTKCRAVVPYVKAVVALPVTREMEIMKSRVDQTIYRSNSDLTVEEDVNGSRNSASPKHVHPKLPDYDEIAAKFMALKKVHQQKQTSLQVR